MTTTDDNFIFWKDKQPQQKYSNLNLNQNNQFFGGNVQSKNVKNQNKEILNYDNSFNNNDSQSKQKYSTLFGKTKLGPSFSNLNIQKDYGKKEEKPLNANNSSTLSLHISAYENSIDAIFGDPFSDEKDGIDKKKENISSIKNLKAVKEIFNGSSSGVKYAFELPRQQQDQKNNDPEIMQFKASQQLLKVDVTQPDSSNRKFSIQEVVKTGNILCNRWLVESKLGGGNYGQVLQVTDVFGVFDNKLALKVELDDEEIDDPKMSIEPKILLDLSQHRTLFPELFAFGRYANFNYIVLSMEGPSLQEIQSNRSFFSRYEQIVIGLQVLAGLQKLHMIGYLHRDLKPGNICLNSHGTIFKLIDFGMGRKYLNDNGTIKVARKAAPFRGNFKYASGHSLAFGEQSTTDDLWAFLYIMASLKKRLPWEVVESYNQRILLKLKESGTNLFDHSLPEFSKIITHLKDSTSNQPPSHDYIFAIFKIMEKRLLEKFHDCTWSFHALKSPITSFPELKDSEHSDPHTILMNHDYACYCKTNCQPVLNGDINLKEDDEEITFDESDTTAGLDSLKDNTENCLVNSKFSIEDIRIRGSISHQHQIQRSKGKSLSERNVEIQDEFLPNALMMYPIKEIIFKGPFTDVVTSPLSISNPTEKTIAFKMMVTAPEHYCCRPNIGYVGPGDTVELQVMVEPMKDEKKIEQEKHKFMIQSMFVKDAPGDLKSQASQVDEPEAPNKELPPAVDFWAKDHNKKDIMYHEFTVAFLQSSLANDKLDGILMDLTSFAAAEAAAEMERERRREEAERKERERLLKKGKLTPEERARLEVLLALQALALAKQKLTGILRIVPAEEVIFCGPFSEYACATIRLTNPSSKHIYYKVLVTNPKHYIIKPSFGILKPGETAISVVIIEQQDVYSNIEKEYSQLVGNLVLRDKFMVHAAYANDGSTPIPDFWKKREQGSVYAHKLRIALHLLNAEETVKERERRDKLKSAGYKNKELILSGIYGRDSGLNNYYEKDAFGGPVLPYPGDGPNPYGIGAGPTSADAATTPVGAGGAGFDGNRDPSNMKQPGGGSVEQRPVSAYGGEPLGGTVGSVCAMDAPAGGGGGSGPCGANNINNSPGYNPNMIMGPGGARGLSVMLGPGGGPDGTKSGYAAPGNAYMYAGGANNYGGATGGGAPASAYGGAPLGGAGGSVYAMDYGGGAGGQSGGGGAAGYNAGGGNYGGAGGANNSGNAGGASAANNGPAGSANNRPASAYGGAPLGGAGGSVYAMDYGGGAGGQSGGYNAGGGNYGGAGGANNSDNAGGASGANNGPAGSANNRPASSYGGGPLGGAGVSVRAMDTEAGGGNPGYSSGPGGASGGANGSSGANVAGGQAGSANNRPASSYGGGPLGGPGGSVRATDCGGSSGGNAGNASGNANNAGPGGANAGGGGGPGGSPVMFGAPGGGTNSGYAAPGGGYMYGGGNAGGSGGGNASGTGGGPSDGNSSNSTHDGPQLLGPGEN